MPAKIKIKKFQRFDGFIIIYNMNILLMIINVLINRLYLKYLAEK